MIADWRFKCFTDSSRRWARLVSNITLTVPDHRPLALKTRNSSPDDNARRCAVDPIYPCTKCSHLLIQSLCHIITTLSMQPATQFDPHSQQT